MKTVITRPYLYARMRGYVLLACLTCLSLNADAQPQDAGCQIANAVLGSLFKGSKGVPCGPSAGGSTTPPGPAGSSAYAGGIDTAENEQRVRASLENTYQAIDPSMLDQDPSMGLDSCMKALQPFARFERMLDSRYDELSRRCATIQAPMQQRLQAKATELRRTREQLKADTQRAEQQQETDRIAQIVAELKAGTRKPSNCAQYMVTKGLNPEALDAQVMHVAYRAPTGIGIFVGNIERIDGNTIYLNGRIPDLMRLSVNPPEHMIAITSKETQAYDGSRITAGGMLEGFATQTGTRTVTLTDRRVVTVAVMSVRCMQPK